jgi:coproporphyrinogen dehydrogenase HemZ
MALFIKVDEENLRLEFENTAKLFYANDDVVILKDKLDSLENKYKNENIEKVDGVSNIEKDKNIYISGHVINQNGIKYYKVIYRGVKFSNELLKPFDFLPEDADFIEKKRELKWSIRRFLYKNLQEETEKYLPWGMLNGIRPAKFAMELMYKGAVKETVISEMVNNFWVKENKAELLYKIAEKEKVILDNTPTNSVGLYIGIPFCPSKCLYCSFTSEPILKYKNRLNEYLTSLKKEIKQTSKMLTECGIRVQSLYIGGGTPTSLDEENLKELLSLADEYFASDYLQEYTIEAGRPDSLNLNKLKIIRNSKVDRLSINSQTMNNSTLELIGRMHSVEQFVEIFKLAREIGFNNINTDIIIGLPGETLEMFENTLRGIEVLSPENLTVHTLAVKRASRLYNNIKNYETTNEDIGQKMMDLVFEYADKMELSPYYLYRQKNMLGHLENTGFCKNGRESIYNIQIMEEKQSIIAVGAGAVTKMVYPSQNRIERAFNVKSVDEYMNRVDEMVERKRALFKLGC